MSGKVVSILVAVILFGAWLVSTTEQNRKMDALLQKVSEAAISGKNLRESPPQDIQMRDINSAADDSKTAAESKKAVMAIMANLLSRIESIEASTKASQDALISMQRRLEDLRWAVETGSGDLNHLNDESIPLTAMTDKPRTTIEAISRSQQTNK